MAQSDTAVVLRSGDMPVLATPRLVALCEEAACAAIAGDIDPGSTTVGTRIDLEHLAPSAVGAVVVASAVLDAVDGPRLEFDVSVAGERGVVARGRHRRQVVDRDRFLSRLEPDSA